MKRVIPILLAVCLVVVMAVPAMAAEEACSINGKWLWNDTISRISEQNESVYYSVKFSMEFSDGVRYFDSIGQKYHSYYDVSNGNVVVVLLDFMTDGASNPGGKTYWYYNSITHEVGWRDPFSLIINFGVEKQSVDEEFYTWFTSNATLITCDSSACSSLRRRGSVSDRGSCCCRHRRVRLSTPCWGRTSQSP